MLFSLVPPLILGFLAGLSPSIFPQSIGGDHEAILNFNGSNAGDNFGWSVANAGDLDGDGLDDLVVGADQASPGGRFQAGKVFVFSSSDGGLLLDFEGSFAGDRFGHSVAGAGDIDGDGIPDILVGAPFASPGGNYAGGSAHLFSGQNGSLLMEWHGNWDRIQLGHSVDGAGDVDADGTPDLVVGAPWAGTGYFNRHGSAFIFSGLDGSVIHRLDGSGNLNGAGYCVAGGGNINGDGHPDILVGGLGLSPFMVGGPSTVYAFSGIDGSLAWSIAGTSPSPADCLGYSVDWVGDLNGDGMDEGVFGAPLARPGGRLDAGIVRVFSGPDGSTLFQIDGATGDHFGRTVSGAGDVDGDGFPDIIVSAPSATGDTYLVSGRDQMVIWSIGTVPTAHPQSVAGLGDLDGDGRADFLCGMAHRNPFNLPRAGAAYVSRFNPCLVMSDSTLSLSGAGVDGWMDFSPAFGGQAGAVLVSLGGNGPTNFQGLEIPLTLDSVLQSMLAGWRPGFLPGAFGLLDSQGRRSFSVLPLAGFSALLGSTAWLAAVAAGPGTGVPRFSSIARTLTVAP